MPRFKSRGFTLLLTVLFVFTFCLNLNQNIKNQAKTENEVKQDPGFTVQDPDVELHVDEITLDTEKDPLQEEFKDLLNIEQNARLLRVYKKCWNQVQSFDYSGDYLHENVDVPSEILKCVSKIREIEATPLLDWNANGSMADLYSKYNGRGIVIPVTRYHFHLALVSIYAIRNVHKCELPIEIIINGEWEISDEQKITLLKIRNVKVINLHAIFPPSKVKFSGWSVKAACLLAASCAECILMDADVIFLKSPEIGFEQQRYKRSRMLLFKDRTMPIDDESKWVKNIIPQEEHARLDHYRIFKKETYHECESGVVIIDKNSRFIGLLAITYLNIQQVTEISYAGFHGDKESFWVGMEMVQERYSFDVHNPGSIGYYDQQRDGHKICTVQIVHQDEKGDLFWVNGGGVVDKTDMLNSGFLKFTHWMPEGGGYSFPGTQVNLMCLNSGKEYPRKIPEADLRVLKKLELYWNELLGK